MALERLAELMNGWKTRATGMAPSTSVAAVVVDQDAVQRRLPDGRQETVRFADLVEVAIRTTPHGPWQDDVFFLLTGRDGSGAPCRTARRSGRICCAGSRRCPASTTRRCARRWAAPRTPCSSAGSDPTPTAQAIRHSSRRWVTARGGALQRREGLKQQRRYGSAASPASAAALP